MSHPLRMRRPNLRAPIAGAVLVARPSRWGNPFPVSVYGREEAVRRYGLYLVLHRPDLIARLPELRGRLLACYCPLDEPCHADLLARMANPDDEAPAS